jgi:superfamily I DNA/RNA helicase
MSWLIPRVDLTAEQIRAVELSANEHRVILGAPGSGKTQILLHRAQYLSEELGVSPERFRIFVITNVLKEYIRTALQDLELPEECVTTLDDWCVQLYKQQVRRSVPWDAVNRCPDYPAVRREVHRTIGTTKPFDFVLVDEGQDLDADAFKLIRDLSPHVTVAMDHKQQIYDEGCTESDIIRALGIRRSNLTLLDAFRCCPYVVRIASELINDPRDRAAFLNQSRTSQSDIQTPLLYEAEDFEDERTRLIEVLRERQIVDRSIAIVLAQNRQVEGFAKGLQEIGIPVETRKSGLNFATSLPKIITIHSAKGLTFDSVLMPRLDVKSFTGRMQPMAERLLFVGITRATKWLYMSTIQGKTIPMLQLIRRLADLRPPFVTIGHRSRSHTPTGEVTGPRVEDPLDIL